MNKAPVGIVMTDANGLVLWANTTIVELLRIEPLSLVGSPVDNLVIDSDRTRLTSMLKELQPGEEKVASVCLQGDGRHEISITLQVSLMPAGPTQSSSAHGDEQVLFLFSDADNTDMLARMHREMDMNEAAHHMIVDSMVDALVTTDEYGNIECFNRAAEKMFGYTADEVRGTNVSILMPEMQAKQHDSQMERYKQTGEKRIIGIGREEIAQRKDGSTFPIDLALSEIQYESARKFTGVIRDISERRAFEDELIKAKVKSEEASKAKSEFLARMNHELRTPMNAILGFVQLLQLDGERFDKKQQESLDLIYSSGRHLLELIDDVLDFASIESRGIQVRHEAVAFHDLIKECIGMISPLAQKRQIGISYDGSANTGKRIYADRLRLKEVLVNLLTNAVKYNREDGEIVVACEEMPDGRWRIKVSDTGIGLTLEQQQRLFKPFERLGAEWSEVKGTGLGLSISKHIIESLGGKIGFDSTPGEGSSFWVELDAAEGESAAPAQAEQGSNVTGVSTAAPGRQARSCTILYIEDNYSNQRLVEFLFESRAEIELITALTPEHGLKLAQERQPDLILLDIFLPRIDGFELFKQLQNDERTQGIPVIGMSAHATQEIIEKGMKSGFCSFVSKPIEVEEFHSKIDEAL